MNEIRITIEGLKELTEAVRVLAGMGGGQAAVAGAPQTQPPVPGTATAGQIPTGAPVQPPQIHTGVPVQQPQVPTAAPQNYGQASVQPTVPVAMGAQPPQGPEHPVPDEGQQLEGDEVVAGLLGVPQDTPQQGKGPHAEKQRHQPQRCAEAQHGQDGIAAENSDERGAQMSRQPHKDGKGHKSSQWLHQPDQPGHYLESASASHALLPSLP